METYGLPDRFWSKVNIGLEDECWEWTGALDRVGYASYSAFGTSHAYRVLMIARCGELPSSIVVRHMCANKKCLNPKHLRLGTQADNVQDHLESGNRKRPQAAPKQYVTEPAEYDKPAHMCRRGHDTSDGSPNLYKWTDKNGRTKRYCMKCRRGYLKEVVFAE